MSALECFAFAMVFVTAGYWIGYWIGMDAGYVKGRKAVRKYYEQVGK